MSDKPMSDKPTARCSGPLTRRNFLQAGTLGLGGLSLGDLLRLRSEAKTIGQPTPDTSVIFVWLPGGMSHLETYDMKPEAPSDYRGEFRPVHTRVPGMDLCEYLPLHAKIANRFNLIRSMSHKFADHGGGHKRFMTGRIPKTPVNTVNDAPAVGSIVAKMREQQSVGVPNYVSITTSGRAGVDTFAFGAAYLGPTYTPFNLSGNPSAPKFIVRNLAISGAMENRLDDRIQLLKGFDNVRREIDQSGAMDAMDDFNRRAVNLLTSSTARNAFDLDKEDPRLRDRYGRHQWGQRALMARRLVEAGSSFVTIVMENAYVSVPRDGAYNWDSHAVNCHLFNDTRRRLPIYDQPVTALIEDLYSRGLDKKVMLVVATEFGRSPRINYRPGTQTGVIQPGRDHWPSAMSALICGGGMRTGQVIGSTNSKAEHPQDRPLSPNDLWATVYHHLGINSEHTFNNRAGRPMPILPFGKPIAELL